ncbi:MAG: restriction endonuclease [Nitrospira sp.]|nr:restriction endonuclease [Nitrospira sp.]MBH0181551.1 restriction endonuclease [Nitrospira sp.]
MTPKSKKPASQFSRYIGPVLAAIRELGGSGRPDEVRTVVARDLRISDAEQSEPLPSGVQSRFENQVHWARFYLAKAGYIDSSQRGVWTLTEKGRSLGEITPDEIHRIIREVSEQTKSEPGTASPLGVGTDGSAPLVTNYREELGRTLQSLPASGFERFCQRLLRESGFQEVAVTGRSGDGGIDGIGILQVNAFVSFKVLFQCKKYAGSVTPSHVRDFRGAMTGRADKGIIITTGSFTSDARKEAVRDGAPPIELVDGEKLISMLEKLELGLRPRQTFEVDSSFFEEYKK